MTNENKLKDKLEKCIDLIENDINWNHVSEKKLNKLIDKTEAIEDKLLTIA